MRVKSRTCTPQTWSRGCYGQWTTARARYSRGECMALRPSGTIYRSGSRCSSCVSRECCSACPLASTRQKEKTITRSSCSAGIRRVRWRWQSSPVRLLTNRSWRYSPRARRRLHRCTVRESDSRRQSRLGAKTEGGAGGLLGVVEFQELRHVQRGRPEKFETKGTTNVLLQLKREQPTEKN